MKKVLFLIFVILISCGKQSDQSKKDIYQLVEVDYFLNSNSYDFVLYQKNIFQTTALTELEDIREDKINKVIRITTLISPHMYEVAKETGWFTIKDHLVLEKKELFNYHQ